MNLEIWMSLVGLSMALAGVPQAARLFTRKSSEDISLVYWLIVAHGQVWWFIYGLCIRSTSLLVTNSVCFAMSAAVIALTIRYRRRVLMLKNSGP